MSEEDVKWFGYEYDTGFGWSPWQQWLHNKHQYHKNYYCQPIEQITPGWIYSLVYVYYLM